MKEFKQVDTAVLLVIVAAYSADYGRVLTPVETRDCKATISFLQKEIAMRKDIKGIVLRQSA